MNKPITGYENYLIFDDGRVINTNTNKTLATQFNSKGYLTVNLWKHNKLKKCLVHRLVAKAFLDNPDNLPCINHIDKNKLNNHISNLEWCTQKYNIQYSLEDMRKARDCKGYRTPIRGFINNEWVTFPSINEAHRQTGASINTIRSSLKKNYKNPRIIWEYVEK